MKRILPGFIFVSCFLTSSYCQRFTVRDIELGIQTYLYPETIKNLQWQGGSDKYLYSSDTLLYSSDVITRQNELLISLNEINALVTELGEPEFKILPAIRSTSEDEICFKSETCLFLLNYKNKTSVLFRIPDSAENMAINPHYKLIAYTLGSNIYLEDSTQQVLQVTFDTVDGIRNGDIVYRSEFGIETGLFWSPGGNYLAYYRKDETMVTKYPLININAPIAKPAPIRYPMAGMKSEETDVWVYSLKDKSHTRLQIEGDRDQYNTNLSWTPDESAIYIQHLNRDQDSMVLRSYSSSTGELNAVLFTETNPCYVEPENPLVFSHLQPGDFFYQSQQSGYNHIFCYDASEHKLEQLTSGKWEVVKFLGCDTTEQSLFFIATGKPPLEFHLYRFDRNTGNLQRLTSEAGTHEVIMNKSGSFFIDNFSSYTVPRKIALLNNSGNIVSELLTAKNPIEEYELGEVITDTLLAADGKTTLYYQITKPVNFKAKKRYPVLVYIYGGPHLQLINNTWMDRQAYFNQYMAQHGYLTFMIDTRGSDYRGKEFEEIIYRQTGIPQLEDVMEGIKLLKTLRYVDTTRIGVHGWSFGGYMAISLMLNYPDVFKAGVAGGPVIDWKYYEVMYGERYMDTPLQNPVGYAKTSLLDKVDRLKGKLLIIHGGIDPVVVPQNSLLFLQEAIKHDKDVEYFIYPDHEHNVDGMARIHLTRMITSYFFNHL